MYSIKNYIYNGGNRVLLYQMVCEWWAGIREDLFR